METVIILAVIVTVTNHKDFIIKSLDGLANQIKKSMKKYITSKTVANLKHVF